MQQVVDILKRYWGYDDFLPLQREAIQCGVSRRDSLVVLPTGGGKSLCFQVPAVRLPGLAIVVSPLISLMKDQVDALTE
ncbi:MAG: DEAD/DEAH box helicase, partial [Spirochaetaceae bacterium]|nr:DEAD/DEAH box helicase [Spirochaetaceae bacterium]